MVPRNPMDLFYRALPCPFVMRTTGMALAPVPGTRPASRPGRTWISLGDMPDAKGTAKGTTVNPRDEIDHLIAQHPDWRGAVLAHLRKTILEVDPDIIEEWKWMGSPVWSCGGILCVGNIFKHRVKLVFNDGAVLPDPNHVFNAGLDGNKWRAIDISEGDAVDDDALQALVRAAVDLNRAKPKRK